MNSKVGEETSREEVKNEFEELVAGYSDEEIRGLLGIAKFLMVFDDAEERLAHIGDDKPNYCPNCGEKL